MGALLALRGFIAFIPAFIWKWLAIAAIGGVLFLAGDIRGRRIEKAICAEAAHQADLAADAQDDAAGKEVTTQNDEVQNQLLKQKEKDDAIIAELQRRLDEKPEQPAAGKPVHAPVLAPCVYDKSNADPDDQPPAQRLRLPDPRPRAGNKKAPRPASVPAAGGSAKGGRWPLAIHRGGTTKAGDR